MKSIIRATMKLNFENKFFEMPEVINLVDQFQELHDKFALVMSELNIPQQVYRLSEKAVPPFRGKCTAYPPRCTAYSLGYDVKII